MVGAGTWPYGGSLWAVEIFDDGTGPGVFVGGSFQNAGGTVRNLAKWDGAQWVGVGGGVVGKVEALRAFTDQGVPSLFVTGSGSEAGGLPTDGIAAWTGSGWKRWFSVPAYAGQLSAGYDPVRAHTVLLADFHGGESTGLADTWIWDGTTWARSASVGPRVRSSATMAFDTTRQRLLMLGGIPNGSPETRNTLWAWSGTQWSVASVAPAGMAAEGEFGMAYDAARDRLVVFGGVVGQSVQSNETWEYDGAS